MLEAINWLMRLVNEWDLNADAGLIQLYSYWDFCLTNDDVYLTMHVDKQDAITNTIEAVQYSDSDHASDFSRKSTGGAGTMMESTQTENTYALLDYAVKSQASTARSSGESETVQCDHIAKSLTEADVTQDEHDLIVRSADAVKAAAVVLQRTVYPCQLLLEFITNQHERANIPLTTLRVDASVAQSVSVSGESRALAYVKKVHAVDLGNLRDTLRHLQLRVEHVHTDKNVADIFTKAVSRKTLDTILHIVGRRSGHAAKFKKKGA